MRKESEVFFIHFFLRRSQVMMEEMSFQVSLENCQGLSIPDGGGGGGNVLESDFEPLCDGTTRRRSLADLRLLEGM